MAVCPSRVVPSVRSDGARVCRVLLVVEALVCAIAYGSYFLEGVGCVVSCAERERAVENRSSLEKGVVQLAAL